MTGLLVVSGPPGSGKSTVSRAVAGAMDLAGTSLDARHLLTDASADVPAIVEEIGRRRRQGLLRAQLLGEA